MPFEFDALWTNGLLVTCQKNLDCISNGAIAVKNGKIAWLGPLQNFSNLSAEKIYDLKGKCLTPGLIDCHTHLIYGGNRAQEFELRLQGMSYADIAAEGGGIQSTVSATRAISEEDLFQQSVKRAFALLQSGVTTLEIKSGYGLDWPTELKMLRVMQRIEQALPLTIKKTFLGAHTIPKEYRDRADDYVNLICNEMIPLIVREKLADAIDVFCEKIAFNLSQAEKIFATAQKFNLKIKCHAEQLSNSGAATLAAKYAALSVDHLEYLSETSIQVIAKYGTTAVLLPGAFYFLRETQLPPIDLLRRYQIPMAIASDSNPGTSPTLSLPLMMNMACTLFRLTPEEALMGTTHHAAKALGIDNEYGTLEIGKVADFAIWDVQQPIELVYYFGNNPLHSLVKEGAVIPLTNDF